MSLERMLSLLRKKQAMGVLQTFLPPIQDVKEPLLVMVQIQQGQMISCQLMGEYSRAVYQQGEAASELLRGGVFVWTWTQASDLATQSVSSSFPGSSYEPGPIPLSPISPALAAQPLNFSSGSPLSRSADWSPRRKRAVRPQEIASCIPAPHQRRALHIYALCDGSYSLGKIAAVLHLPLETVHHIVSELVKRGYL
ncbi:MAG: hypothetical protein J2P36_13445, partial [Ktedonobacteraceae bacterium]|nr:hypothetical protein [Ktedonobacteraceae bacterium]